MSNNNSRSQIHTELFSSRHADSNVSGRGISTFAKEQTRFRISNVPKELRTTETQKCMNKFNVIDLSTDVNISPRAQLDLERDGDNSKTHLV